MRLAVYGNRLRSRSKMGAEPFLSGESSGRGEVPNAYRDAPSKASCLEVLLRPTIRHVAADSLAHRAFVRMPFCPKITSQLAAILAEGWQSSPTYMWYAAAQTKPHRRNTLLRGYPSGEFAIFLS
jgi:hypothetical protein